MDLGYLASCYDPENNKKTQMEMDKAFQNICEITGLHGRWQITHQKPTIVCDTGHNVAGWQYISQQLANIECKKMRIVFGVVEDKDVYGIMQLLPKNAIYYFTKPDSKRAFPETSLKVFGDQFGLESNCYSTVMQAYNTAFAEASPDDFIFIGGSSYVVADFLKSRN
jgi:dihydrofolate synthase/folylpolyglutamate synthase